MTDREARRRRHRRRRRLIRAGTAPGLIYVDFEGRIADPLVLLGVLHAPDPAAADWQITQYVFDDRCALVDEACDAGSHRMPITVALGRLLDLSDGEARHIVSWSEYDRDLIREHSGGRSFRWRNAIPTARRLRLDGPSDAEGPTGPNTLSFYEELIGYERPPERRGVGDSIAYIHERSSITDGSKERWQGILTHNRHDLLAMRAVVERALQGR